jgi:hypothetical protein
VPFRSASSPSDIPSISEELLANYLGRIPVTIITEDSIFYCSSTTIRVFFGEKQKNLQKTALEKFVHNESHKPKETIKKVNPAVTGNLASTLTQAFVILVCTRCGQNMTRAMKSCKKYNCRWCCEKGDIRFFTLRQLFGKNSDSELVEQFLRKKMQQVIYLFIILTCF